MLIVNKNVLEFPRSETSKIIIKNSKTYASLIAYSIANAHWGVDGECFIRIGFPKSRGAIADLKGNQNGKFQGSITINKLYWINTLTKCCSNWLYFYFTSTTMNHFNFFILKKIIRILNVVFKMSNWFINFTTRLTNRFSHFFYY